MVEFDWDEGNRTHLEERHGITMAEVEQVLAGSPVAYTADYRNGELRATYVGPTAAGRLLHVVTTLRGERVRVITAYPARPAMKTYYERHRREDRDEGENS